ncbi:MAG TPA: hypothetical protein VGQ57_06095 [Polyangiaceae bacterium]|jgi:hypothetical protein|nr:hypothetical protein [Polyangiaceae bacterium]
MAFPTIPLVLGAGAVWLLTRANKAPSFVPVQASSGRKWLTRTLAVNGTGPTRTSTVEVWAPAGSYGPHLDMLIATYRQTGSDTNSRVAISTGPSALPQQITDAGVDFGIRKPTTASK